MWQKEIRIFNCKHDEKWKTFPKNLSEREENNEFYAIMPFYKSKKINYIESIDFVEVI